MPSIGHVFTAIGLCAIVVGIPAFFSAATLRVLSAREAALETRTAQLIQAATQRSQFVASMTHELRTPIHGVQGLSDVIAALQTDNEVVRWPALDSYFGGVAAIGPSGLGADPRRGGDVRRILSDPS